LLQQIIQLNSEKYLFRAELVSAALEVAANKRKCHYEPILSRKLKTHVELVFKYFAVETAKR